MEDLQEFITFDGSFSLYSNQYKENFHCVQGALYEAENKFINPSNLERFRNKSINVLDICFGLGYNSSFLFNVLLDQSSYLNWYALEIDRRPLNYSLNNQKFRNLWDPKVNQILESLFINSTFKDHFFTCKVLWGDAREQISKIPKNTNFDLIYLDGFSPQKCPEIWSVEFITKIKNKLNKKGYIITYSSAAAVRQTFKSLGLDLYNISPKKANDKEWSIGTLAKRMCDEDQLETNALIKRLSIMEEEHLYTKAATPYRDPENNSLSFEILKRREEEQLMSTLKNTNEWRKKWK